MLAVESVAQGRTRGDSGQLKVFAVMIGLYVLAAAVYILVPGGMLDPASTPAALAAMPRSNLPAWQIVLANAALIVVFYAPLGLLGYWLTRLARLPGIYRPGAGWRNWAVRPLAIGAAAGLVLMAFDLGASRLGGFMSFPHPKFPASILASLSAGIGEEILTRLFVMGLWAFVLTRLLARIFPGRRTRPVALWIANGIAALAFAASHLPAVMLLAGGTNAAGGLTFDLSAVPVFTLVEGFLLNGLVGILAGRAAQRDGLVAASGIHFWADIVWHVIYGVLG